MRLNIKRFKELAEINGVKNGDICRSTGLSKKALDWILENGLIELTTCEVLADAIGCNVSEVSLSDYDGYAENVIEWVKDRDRATLSLSQKRTISRVKKLAESRPEECKIVAENQDGSIYAHVPVSWIRINPTLELTEEQREIKAARFRENVLQR